MNYTHLFVSTSARRRVRTSQLIGMPSSSRSSLLGSLSLQRTGPTQHTFVDEQGTRFWPRCTFQGLRDDPVDQFLFVFFGGQMRQVAAHTCDMWYEPTKRTHCPCAAPASLLGGQHTVVEIGANDGLHMSNSYFFEQHLGWRSLCIEANPVTYQRLVVNRPRCAKVNALVGKPSAGLTEMVPFISLSRPLGQEKSIAYRDWETGLSGIEGSGHREISSIAAARSFARKHPPLVANRSMLPLRPFARILDEHAVHEIDVLFVDVEGAELTVLSSIDFDAVRIGAIVVEVMTPSAVLPSRAANADASPGSASNESSPAWQAQAISKRGRAVRSLRVTPTPPAACRVPRAARHVSRAHAGAQVASFLGAKGFKRLRGLSFSLGDNVFVSQELLAAGAREHARAPLRQQAGSSAIPRAGARPLVASMRASACHLCGSWCTAIGLGSGCG